MPFIGKIARPAPSFDHQVGTFDVTEELILIDEDHAFVKKEDQVVGIVCLDQLLEKYKSADISDTEIVIFAEPLFSVDEYEDKLKALGLMLDKNIEHIAVTNKAGVFVGIASMEQLKKNMSAC